MVRWYLTGKKKKKKKTKMKVKPGHNKGNTRMQTKRERERERDQNCEYVLVNSLQISFFFLSCSFPLSTSACYWDPEVTRRVKGEVYLTCTVSGEDYNAFTDRGDGVVAHAMHDRLLHPSSQP